MKLETPDIDRLHYVTEQDAAPEDLDDALARFLLALVGHDDPTHGTPAVGTGFIVTRSRPRRNGELAIDL